MLNSSANISPASPPTLPNEILMMIIAIILAGEQRVSNLALKQHCPAECDSLSARLMNRQKDARLINYALTNRLFFHQTVPVVRQLLTDAKSDENQYSVEVDEGGFLPRRRIRARELVQNAAWFQAHEFDANPIEDHLRPFGAEPRVPVGSVRAAQDVVERVAILEQVLGSLDGLAARKGWIGKRETAAEVG